MYSRGLLERFHRPIHVGIADPETARGSRGNPTCGDVIEISLRVDEGVITEARFKALGCAVAIASSEAICEIVEGTSPVEAEMLSPSEVASRLDGVPSEREPCAAAALEALRDAIRRLPDGPG